MFTLIEHRLFFCYLNYIFFRVTSKIILAILKIVLLLSQIRYVKIVWLLSLTSSVFNTKSQLQNKMSQQDHIIIKLVVMKNRTENTSIKLIEQLDILGQTVHVCTMYMSTIHGSSIIYKLFI